MYIKKHIITIACLGLALLIGSGRVTAEVSILEPMQAKVVRTDRQIAVFYYLTNTQGKFEVISTVIGTAENSHPIRQRVQLSQGQLYTFTLDGGSGESATTEINFEAASNSLNVALN